MRQDPAPYDGGPISTIFDKLDEAKRKKLDTAIIKRDPTSLIKIHEKFQLADKGISHQALYRYARRVRDEADKAILLDKCLADEIDIDSAIFKFIKRQALEILMHQNPNMLDVGRASLTMRRCQQFQLAAAYPRVPAASRRDNYSDPEAIWGRHDDGTPITHQEHLAKLNRVTKHVLGIPLPGYVEPDDQSRARESETRRGGEAVSSPSPFAPSRQSSDPNRAHDQSRWREPADDPSSDRKGAVSSAARAEIDHQSSDPTRARDQSCWSKSRRGDREPAEVPSRASESQTRRVGTTSPGWGGEAVINADILALTHESNDPSNPPANPKLSAHSGTASNPQSEIRNPQFQDGLRRPPIQSNEKNDPTPRPVEPTLPETPLPGEV